MKTTRKAIVMRDTIFWNEDDSASSTFVQKYKNSGISQYASFASFHVQHPSQQTSQVNKLLAILEVDVLPTIFYEGQAFQGLAAFEWLDFQISEIRRGANPNQEHAQPTSMHAPTSADEAGLAPYEGEAFQGESPFHNIVAGSDRRGISEEQLRAAEHERLAQLPPPVTRK